MYLGPTTTFTEDRAGDRGGNNSSIGVNTSYIEGHYKVLGSRRKSLGGFVDLRAEKMQEQRGCATPGVGVVTRYIKATIPESKHTAYAKYNL